MKKLIKIIPLLLLCLSFSSCNSYEYVKLSEEQHSEIKEWTITSLGYENKFGEPNMKDFPINFSMYQDVTTSHYDKSIYYVNMEDALANDYYLCAYLSNDIKELITSKTPEDYQGEVGFPWLDYFDEETYDGYNNYLKYYYLISVIDKQFIYKDYPIQWYQIEKGKKIPEEIDDSFLVFVGEIYTLQLYDCERQTKVNKVIIEENKEVYLNLKNTKNIKSGGLFSGEYMIIDNAGLFKYNYVFSSSLKTSIIHFSLLCEQIDDEKYVLIKQDPVVYYQSSSGYYFDDDLREFYEYIEKGNDGYLFKFIDIWKLFTRQADFLDYDNYKGYYEEPREVIVENAIVLDVYDNGESLLLWDKEYFITDKIENPKVGDKYNLTFEVEEVLGVTSLKVYPFEFESKFVSYELISSIEEKEGMNFIQYIYFEKNNIPGYYLDEIIYYETGTLLTDAVSSYVAKKGTSLQDYFLSYTKKPMFIEINAEYVEKYSLEEKYLTSNITVFNVSN